MASEKMVAGSQSVGAGKEVAAVVGRQRVVGMHDFPGYPTGFAVEQIVSLEPGNLGLLGKEKGRCHKARLETPRGTLLKACDSLRRSLARGDVRHEIIRWLPSWRRPALPRAGSPLPCETENDRELARTATVTGIPMQSSPVTLPTRVMPTCCAIGATLASVLSGEVVRCVPAIDLRAGPERTSAKSATLRRCTADDCAYRKNAQGAAKSLVAVFLTRGRRGWLSGLPAPALAAGAAARDDHRTDGDGDRPSVGCLVHQQPSQMQGLARVTHTQRRPDETRIFSPSIFTTTSWDLKSGRLGGCGFTSLWRC